MTYLTTITKKGQITIPKEIRNIFNLEEGKKLELELEREKREVRIKPTHDFLKFVKKIKVKKKVDPVKAREYMEKFYVRI